MEGAGQLRRLNSDAGCQIYERHARICQGIREPLIQSDRQDQTRKFDQLGNFPERNRTDSDFVILVVFDQLRVGTVEP